MAKMKRNIGELVSGKIGNVVFYQLRGKSYVKAAPVRKKDSWTQDQLLYRQRMSKASGLWRALRSEQFSKIWNAATDHMNGYAWFLKKNMPALEMDGTLIDPHYPHRPAEKRPARNVYTSTASDQCQPPLFIHDIGGWKGVF